jgi:hypothetical protein
MAMVFHAGMHWSKASIALAFFVSFFPNPRASANLTSRDFFLNIQMFNSLLTYRFRFSIVSGRLNDVI